jgi:dipeptide/tripeptide permease
MFFVHRLHMTEREATEAMALFAVASYATPLFGAYVSDALIGRYKTITRLSVVYLIGTVIMSLAAAMTSTNLVIVALSLVALGTGGIKPNVSAFGGDQIDPPEPIALQRFFSFFYAAINAGLT